LKYIWYEVDFRINYEKDITKIAKQKLDKRLSFLNDINSRMTLNRNPLVIYHQAACQAAYGDFVRRDRLNELAEQVQNTSEIWKTRIMKFGTGVSYDNFNAS